jgi:hypothetical protein
MDGARNALERQPSLLCSDPGRGQPDCQLEVGQPGDSFESKEGKQDQEWEPEWNVNELGEEAQKLR